MDSSSLLLKKALRDINSLQGTLKEYEKEVDKEINNGFDHIPEEGRKQFAESLNNQINEINETKGVMKDKLKEVHKRFSE